MTYIRNIPEETELKVTGKKKKTGMHQKIHTAFPPTHPTLGPM